MLAKAEAVRLHLTKLVGLANAEAERTSTPDKQRMMNALPMVGKHNTFLLAGIDTLPVGSTFDAESGVFYCNCPFPDGRPPACIRFCSRAGTHFKRIGEGGGGRKSVRGQS